jgi:ribosomal protein S25
MRQIEAHMGSRERSESGHYVETVTQDRVLDVFDDVEGPVVTSSDVAESLDCTTEAARRKLQSLYDEGVLDRRKTGRTLIYWRTEALTEEIPRDDPFFGSEPAAEGGAGDVSENVDGYLYGDGDA